MKNLEHEPLDADGRRAAASCSTARRHPEPLEPVGHGEGDLGRRRIAQPRVARERDDVLAAVLHERADERAVVVPVGIDVAPDSRSPGRTVPWKRICRLVGREILKEARRGVAVGGRRRAPAQRLTVLQDDVGAAAVTGPSRRSS